MVRAPRTFRIVDDEGIKSVKISDRSEYRQLRKVLAPEEKDADAEVVVRHEKEYKEFMRQTAVPGSFTRTYSQRKSEANVGGDSKAKKQVKGEEGMEDPNSKKFGEILKIMRQPDDFYNKSSYRHDIKHVRRQYPLGQKSSLPLIVFSGGEKVREGTVRTEDKSPESRTEGGGWFYSPRDGHRYANLFTDTTVQEDTPNPFLRRKFNYNKLASSRGFPSQSPPSLQLKHPTQPNNYHQSTLLFNNTFHRTPSKHKLPANIYPSQQDYNNFYCSIDQTLRRLINSEYELRQQQQQQQHHHQHQSTNSLQNAHTSLQGRRKRLEGVGESRTERDIDSLQKKIRELRVVKKDTRTYLSMLHRVDDLNRLRFQGEEKIRVVQEKVDEFNRRMYDTGLAIMEDIEGNEVVATSSEEEGRKAIGTDSEEELSTPRLRNRSRLQLEVDVAPLSPELKPGKKPRGLNIKVQNMSPTEKLRKKGKQTRKDKTPHSPDSSHRSPLTSRRNLNLDSNKSSYSHRLPTFSEKEGYKSHWMELVERLLNYENIFSLETRPLTESKPSSSGRASAFCIVLTTDKPVDIGYYSSIGINSIPFAPASTSSQESLQAVYLLKYYTREDILLDNDLFLQGGCTLCKKYIDDKPHIE